MFIALLALLGGVWLWRGARSPGEPEADGTPAHSGSPHAGDADVGDAPPEAPADAAGATAANGSKPTAAPGAAAPEMAGQDPSRAPPVAPVNSAEESEFGGPPPGDAGAVLVPAGWAFDTPEGDGIHWLESDAEVAVQGRSARIESRHNDSPWQGFGRLVQVVDADALGGSVVEFSASLKTRGARSGVGIWIRADDQEGMVIVNGPTDGASGTRDWASYSVELAIPKEAKRIVYGIEAGGVGTAWADEARLTVSGEKGRRGAGSGRYHTRKVPATLREPFNLSFDATVARAEAPQAQER